MNEGEGEDGEEEDEDEKDTERRRMQENTGHAYGWGRRTHGRTDVATERQGGDDR